MNAMTIHAYAEGRNMQTPQEYAQAQQAFADTREMTMSALGVTDDIDAYLDTLGETPAEQLKKGVEAAKEKGLDEKAANAALSAYLNAREQQKGAMDGITSDESIRRQHADSVIRQITFENEADSEGDSGKVILVNVKGREKPVFLVRGRYENGSITGETVVVSEGNGVIEMIPASEVEGIVEESDAVTERQRKYDKIDAENKEQQRLINLNMDTPLAGQGGILMDEEGHRRQVGIKCVFNDEQGNPASVLVVDQNNNDYLIPIDVFREQRGRGRKFEAIEPYLDETDEEYHATEGPMNEEYNLANKEQEGVSEEDAQGAAEGVTPQPTTDTTEKPTKPEVKYDYHVKMKDGSGNVVSGRVTNLSADGVEIEFDAPYNGKMVDRIPLADFDNGVSEIADANGNVLWNETEAVGDTEVVPQVDATPTQAGQEDAEKSAIAQAEQEHKPTALERIPHSENGEPLFEQAENPEVAWDALVEFSDGNAATAKEIADAMTEEKRKALEKARKLKLKGKTPAEMLASKQANAAELAKAESEYNHWQRMANVEQNRQNAIRAQQEAEARQRATERAEAEKAKREAREEAERREREALEGIPEWHMDTPENARKRGARRYGGQIFTRQEPVNGVVGKEVEVKFSQKDLPKGHVVVMEAEQLQPSHIQGKRNPMFFIEEAQPKNRAEDVSQTAARNIAENIRPQEITSSTTAYTGAPTINTRGEVIQGNNRSDALRYLWQNNLPEQQQAYKQYLLDQAEQLGLDSNAINAMQHPVLVNQLDVDDAEAIRLGQMTAQDTESGGVERIKPKNVAQKLGDNMRTFANRLLSSSDNDATFGQLVDRNGEDVLNWMNQIGAISNTQYQSAFDSKGKLTPEAKNDLQKVLYQAVFKGGSQQLEEMFDRLPAKAQRAILSTAFRDMDSPFAGKMLSEIQSSIIAYNALMQDEGFASAKNMEEVLRAIEIFKHQTALDDRFEQYMPADNFSNFALHLAGLYKASDMSQTTIASYFNEMYDLAQGKKAATLFEEADTTEYPLAEVIKKVLGIDYKPAKNGNNNVANGGADVALRNQESQGRQPRSNKPSASGEQNQTGTESSERGEGVGVSDNEQGRQVDIEVNAPRKGDLAEAQENRPKNSTQAAVENKESKPVRFEAGRRLTKEEKKEVLNTLRDAFKENGVPYHIEESDFGKERRVYEPTSEDWVKSDITGRPLRYYITLPDGRVAHPTELFPNISAREVTGHVNRMALLEKEASELISKQLNGFPSEYIPTAISILEKMQSLPHDVRDMGYGPYFLVSYDYIFNGKHYGNSPLFVSLFAHSVVKESSDAIEATVKVVNNSYYMVDALLSALKNKYNSTQSAIESASAEVETSPTEAQKKAGNYKMGHVKVGAFDVTIENPKGSERSGTDANGKKWSVKMNNTYGYIRGTEGVDGDHIDVFLAEDMDKWDGKYVFVVDQYNPDGTFDEHKVMLGFNSTEEARSAYLSNYEKGWENGRRIVVAKIKTDGFQKWVDSSHRKTKPFAHYVIAGAADVAEGKPKNESDRAIPPSTSGRVRMQKTQGYSEFAEKHGVNADDVRAYAEGMALGNVVMANQAFTEIRRTKRIEHRGMKLSEFAKAFKPIKEELYEKFGNVDELNQEYVRRAEEERNMMEAARKKAEEEERKRQAHLDELSLLDDAAIDERYMEALQRGDEATAREMLDEAARRKGYSDTASDYQGVGAWVAPANPGYENDADRRADVEDNAPDVNIEDIALGYSLVDEKYWQEPRKYMQIDATAIESVNAIREAIAAVRRGEKNVKVKVYRAVPTSVKEGKLRNGDWVTPSKDYAMMHGEHRLEGKYRIIEDEVSVNELWWDGNDSREWGFDNGKGYKYKNVKNNRKSDDLVTRDDKGNVIPPSKRFNQRKADERYQKAGTPLTPNSAEVALRDAIADLMRKSGLDVIDHEVGQQVLDEANRDELRMSLNDNREYEGKTSKERSDIQYKKAKELLSALHEAGFKGFEISRSITPFGVSTYIQGDLGLKFRISDHGVSSFGRIFGEEHISLNTSSEYVVQLAKDRKKDINAQAEKYKKERAIKEEREKRANEKWNRIKANFEGMVFKRNDRTYQDYDTFSNSISINRQNGHKYQRRYVMQTAIGKSGADTAYRYEWAEPADVDEYGVATNIGSDRPSLEFIEAYDEADTAPIIREHRVYHGSGIRFFRTSNGEAYGFTVGGKIYIDPRIATAETPIHEYAHLWATAMREGNPTEWKNIVGLMKGTSVWAEVQKLYPELKNDDDIADEVLATFSGRRGAERLRAEQQKIMQSNGSVFEKAAAVGALARVKQALSKFWKGVADFFGIHYTSAEEVADRVMKDLLEGVDHRKFGGKNDERVRKQFIGEKGAAAADHAEEVGVRLDNLAVARKMEEAGKDAKAIKMATGWERGADGKWRYEVGDVRFYDGLQLVNRNEKSTVTLNDLLEDNKEKDALFASYPSLKDMPVTLEDMGYNGAGEYSYKDKSLRLNTYLLTDDSGRFTEPAVSILNHEIQHAIQHIEGFARGGSLEEGQHYADEHKPLTPVQGDFVDTVNLYDKNKHTLSETYTLAKFVKDWAMFNDDDFSKDLLGMSDEQIRSEYERLKERQQHGGKPSRLNGFDAYKRFSGEVESRNVEARMGMTDEERRASLAAETEDVSREDQIFLQNGLNGVSESREPSIWLPKDEYAKVAHAIATNTGLKKTGMHYVFTDNNYYIYTGKKNGGFLRSLRIVH